MNDLINAGGGGILDLLHGDGDTYTVLSSSAHAWAEVYIEGRLSIRVWRLAGIGLGLLFSFLKNSP